MQKTFRKNPWGPVTTPAQTYQPAYCNIWADVGIGPYGTYLVGS